MMAFLLRQRRLPLRQHTVYWHFGCSRFAVVFVVATTRRWHRPQPTKDIKGSHTRALHRINHIFLPVHFSTRVPWISVYDRTSHKFLRRQPIKMHRRHLTIQYIRAKRCIAVCDICSLCYTSVHVPATHKHIHGPCRCVRICIMQCQTSGRYECLTCVHAKRRWTHEEVGM